ncbi:DUF4199 domain-containing protein [Maribacter cobaltidurans]|jgi:hypothetical protein|uniref:DUF4199 domain-containing protein n=1 Tax=Maribacter cobaltidurans TaxID=1178778 RepID=A0A223VA95_9FLAO|nr:DUF4199 domain-containing protein [Maribacter cobaltidurans]ASV31888.1 DUF4199 domain-containing protein [Maribacter cobaltidurans]GGD85412.1 hypothetical protein GCM10011412_24000 [Maribacter cobaltidurans]
MEENKPKTGKYALNFGVITGVVGVVFAIMLFTMDMHYEQGAAVQITQTVILAVGIVLGILQFKKSNNGFLSISESLKVGAGVALIAGIIGLIWFFVLSNVVEPDYMDKMYEIGKVKAMEQNPKLTSEQIDQGIEMQKKFAWISYPVILVINVIIGLIVGLITGLVAKKQEAAY